MSTRLLALVSLTLDWLMDVGLVDGAVGIPRDGRELRAHAATPYLSGIPDRDVVTLPVRAVERRCYPTDDTSVARALQRPRRFITMPMGLCCLLVSSLLFSQFQLVVQDFICM